MAHGNTKELFAAMHKDKKDEKSTSTMLLNALRFKQAQDREELLALYRKDKSNCKNEEPVTNGRSDNFAGLSPPFGHVIDKQRYDVLPTLPVNQLQHPPANFHVLPNYCQNSPHQVWLNNYQQALRLQVNFDANLSQSSGHANLFNQRHNVGKHF